ncbi:MAG: AraC family transcriptional regulator [Armatimonadetes bacterium]|nr:AraC family transcriptional regulator [Armatimonadota bacterium]
MSERCIACGMPMDSLADRAGGDPHKVYCIQCARPDGTMQSYEEKLESLTSFIMKSEGRNEESARQKATNWMARQPAWRR